MPDHRARSTAAASPSKELVRDLLARDLEDLLAQADELRRSVWGDRVSFCAIINARCGVCGEDCAFCAQSSRYDTGVQPYPLVGADEMVEAARRAELGGARRLGIVTSGAAVSDAELDRICRSVARVRRETAILPCASLGELSAPAARRLAEAGLSRYHHNLETSARFFPRICTTHAYDDRVRTVRVALDAGLPVCSGGLFGMGESWDDRVDLALALGELGVSSVPVNFLMPVPGTPLAAMTPLDPEDALRVIALFRLLLPEAEVRVCGGRHVALAGAGDLIYRAGATGAMVGDYLTQPGRDPGLDMQTAARLGLRVV